VVEVDHRDQSDRQPGDGKIFVLPIADAVRVRPARAPSPLKSQSPETRTQKENIMASTEKEARHSGTPADVKADMLEKYPPKVARKRAKQILINEAWKRTAGNCRQRADHPRHHHHARLHLCRLQGRYLGPTRDIVNITHGPIGCGFYSWLTRRNQTDAGTRRRELHALLLFHRHAGPGHHLRRRKKLARAIQEAYDLFHPKAIAVFATCPVGLIGDDIHAVAKR
jgi:nitrogenase molybdenum-iron protein alpha chain